MILFYGLFTEFSDGTSPKTTEDHEPEIKEELHDKYPLF